MIVTVLTESDTGRYRHLGFLKQELGKLYGAHLFRRLRDLRPDKHRALWFRYFPTCPVKAVNQRIPALLIHQPDPLDAVLGTIQGVNRGDLDRLKNPVVKGTLDSPQGMDNIPITHRKPHPPPRHVVTFRQRKKFDSDLFSTWNLKQARRLVTIEGQIRICQVVNHDQLIFLCELDDALEEIQLHYFRGWIMGKTDDKQFGLRPGLLDCFFEMAKKSLAGNQRNTTKVTARQNHGKLMDRIRRAGTQHNVSGVYNRPCQMRQPFFGANGDDRLTIRIKVHLIPALVPIADGNAELVNPSGDGVAMVLWLCVAFATLWHNRGRRRQIGITHCASDGVFAPSTRFHFHTVDDAEHVGRQPFDALKFHAILFYPFKADLL